MYTIESLSCLIFINYCKYRSLKNLALQSFETFGKFHKWRTKFSATHIYIYINSIALLPVPVYCIIYIHRY